MFIGGYIGEGYMVNKANGSVGDWTQSDPLDQFRPIYLCDL